MGHRRYPSRPEVVDFILTWFETQDDNPWYRKVRGTFIDASAFEIGAAIRDYRKRRGLKHPADLRRAVWKARDDARTHAVADGVFQKDIAKAEGTSAVTICRKMRTAAARNEAAAIRRESTAGVDIEKIKDQLSAIGLPQ